MRLPALLLSVTCLSAQSPEFFEKKVRPLLAAKCQPCHNTKVKTAGLDLSTAAGFAAGGASGPLVRPTHSLLLNVVSYEERIKMPPTGKLTNDEIAVLTEWVKSGAHWPGAAAVKVAPRVGTTTFTEEQKRFWAFQPLAAPAIPPVRDAAWPSNPVDRFILAEIEAKGLRPAAPATKYELLRRATFDLTGLPPTESEIRAFLADQSPQAFAKVIDRLLASPRYGERWGRHWLDVARYADSTGNDEDHRYPYAWRYRDYVIDAFNSDLPYDQFVREQVAGDLLPSGDGSPLNRRGIVATGFLALGAKAIAQQDKKKMLYDVYDEQVDVTSKAILGLTVACARCHDHKFDPILTRDYYALTGIFASTRSFEDPTPNVAKLLFVPLVPADEWKRYQEHQEHVAAKSREIESLVEAGIERWQAGLLPRLAEYMVAARAVYAGRGDLDSIGRERKLEPALLRKWVAYLKPDETARPHLDDWQHSSSPEQTARAYQLRAEAAFQSWTAALAKWRATSPLPPKPQFSEEEDRFFAQVFFNNGPFGPGKPEARDKFLAAEDQARRSDIQQQIEALKKNGPPEPDLACAVTEGERVEQKVFIRGDYASPGAPAPPAVPRILARPGDPPFTSGSGRLALAQWLTRPDHPLTARVMVNRIWQGHFGEGIVRTPDNFGFTGDRPSHPALLDYLAREFVSSGWSIKAMHRLIMLSRTYQLSSIETAGQAKLDSENRLFAHFPRRRLSIEEIRDGLLAIDGSLDVTVGGTLQRGFGTDKENSSGRLSISPENQRRRTVYLPLRRANLPTLLNLFDFGDATTVTGRRSLTNVAPQALFMMNSGFVAERSANLARTLEEDASLTRERRIESAYLRVLGRPPSPQETAGALSYLDSFALKFPDAGAGALASFCKILMASSEFFYVD